MSRLVYPVDRSKLGYPVERGRLVYPIEDYTNISSRKE